MLTTAAGTIPPAKVFVVGAGVAGLQAIATTRRLGAVVEAFDVRPAVKEEVQSLGAKFVEVKFEGDTATEGGYAKELSEEDKKRTQDLLKDTVAASDVVITTAQVPGKKAPRIISEEMIAGIEDGLMLDGPRNGQADANGEFMFGTARAWPIVNGKLGPLMRGVNISGIAFDVLKTVDRVGSEFVWDLGSGYCGKGQPAKVDAGGPWISCEVLVGGRTG